MSKAGLGLFFCLAALSFASPRSALATPAIRHVFLIVMENENADDTFGPRRDAKYLAQELPSLGASVPQYYGIGHNSLDNSIAVVSGQGPNPDTQEDCQKFTGFQLSSMGADRLEGGRLFACKVLRREAGLQPLIARGPA